MKITVEDIRKLCTESSFERGMGYYYQGSVEDLQQFRNSVTAHVSGTSNYKVTIDIDSENIKANCTCPYDWGGYCKHIVAVLFALSENKDVIQKNKENKEKAIEDIFADTTPEEIKNFLLKEFEKNPILRDHFTIYFSGKGSSDKSLYDYKEEISFLYSDAADSNGLIRYGTCVDFYSIYDLADRYVRTGNIFEALKIFQALSEAIAENMGWVDDSDGYYGGEFSRALESFTECIINAGLKKEEKKSYIRYLFEKYIKKDPDYFREHYYYALKDICESEGDLLYWKELLRPFIPIDLPDREEWLEYYQAREFIMMQLHILDSLDDDKEFYNLIEQFYKKDYEICNIYVDRLEKDGKNNKAVKIAEKGITIFPAHLTIKLRRFLNKYYKDNSKEKYIKNLLFLFVQEHKWTDYDSLKELCPREEWKKMFSVIIDKLSKEKSFNRDIITCIYLKEEMFEEALERIIKEKSLYALSRYYEDLYARFPKEYFEAYRKLIIPFSGSRTGRAHYQEIVGYLKQMKRIKGFEKELTELIDNLKEKYKNRPAFLDEMKNLFKENSNQ